MKRLALVAAVLAVAACGKKNEASTDTTGTMAPPPASTMTPADTMGTKMDTTMMDTSTAMDTTKKM